jgi:hypothetical protein
MAQPHQVQNLIKADERARQAFRFVNRAMHLQRVHIIAAEARQKDKDLTLEAAVAAVDIRKNRSWRPFQLAFLLLNLPSLTDPRTRSARRDRPPSPTCSGSPPVAARLRPTSDWPPIRLRSAACSPTSGGAAAKTASLSSCAIPCAC